MFIKLSEVNGAVVEAMEIIGTGVVVNTTSKKGTMASVFVPNVKLIATPSQDGKGEVVQIVPMFVTVQQQPAENQEA